MNLKNAITMTNGDQEKINFPVFKQTSTVGSKSRLTPSFQLQGIIGDYQIGRAHV